MHRRCIICGQEPGDHCVYPRNMTEARRWQNLANLSTFDVDTESLCRHGCVCASHLDLVQGSNSDSKSSSGAARGASTRAGSTNHDSASRQFGVKRSSTGSGHGPRDVPNVHSYPTNIKAIEEIQNQSKLGLNSGRPESSNVNRCQNGSCRFRGAVTKMFQGNANTYTQMGQNYGYPLMPRSFSAGKGAPLTKISPRVNVNQMPQGTECCTCTHCSMIRITSIRPSVEGCPGSCCPLLRNTKNRPPEESFCRKCPVVRYSGSQQSMNKGHKETSEKNAERHRSFERLNKGHKETSEKNVESHRFCERHCCPAVRNQRSEDSKSLGKDFSSHLNRKLSESWRSNDSTKLTINQQNRIQKPEVKCQCCQACIPRRLKDKEVQVSKEALQSRNSIPVSRTKATPSFSYQTASLSTGFSAVTNSSKRSYGAEQKYSNAINVLLMNGTRKNDYADPCCCPAKSLAPPPEICVQESDLTKCNEQAAFPEIDKPNYRVCRPTTTDPNEMNVLVLEEDPISGCSPKAAGDEATQDRSEVQLSPNQNQSKERQYNLGKNWVDCPATANYTKVLELQRVRIKELENLLQQHNLLQQTIEHKVAELQCTDKPLPKNETEI
ncbi:uncharacterized protein LOC128266122 [Drosophila gunungcola]|uniref:Uncharacterized protein n=1 Tax=Drosophila gunungcola TaxID=103775 RepID=A0A9P9YXC4_9MUSC|nr:uncharacterized protein LOC128266122 [Drosophila gunungcola]XP_052858366.1 uncharacterized protein LOC128266122 [Drosophila gunungcola]KAI8044578.1 hypothetical protein M5D96_000748 [Drosophila gunungcola]